MDLFKIIIVDALYALFITLLIKLVLIKLPREGKGKAVAQRVVAIVGCAVGAFFIPLIFVYISGFKVDPGSSLIWKAIGFVASDDSGGSDVSGSSSNAGSVDGSDITGDAGTPETVDEPDTVPGRDATYWLDDYTYQDPVSGWTLSVPESFFEACGWTTEISEDGKDTTFCVYSAAGGDEPVLTLRSFSMSENTIQILSTGTEIYSSRDAYDGWCSVWVEADYHWIAENSDMTDEICFSAPCMEQLLIADALGHQWPTEYWNDDHSYGVTVPAELEKLVHCTGLGRADTNFYLWETPLFFLEVYPAGTKIAVPALYEDDRIIVCLTCWFNGGISEESPEPESISQNEWEQFYSHMDEIQFVTADGESYSIGKYMKELYPAE